MPFHIKDYFYFCFINENHKRILLVRHLEVASKSAQVYYLVPRLDALRKRGEIGGVLGGSADRKARSASGQLNRIKLLILV
jgi:fatty acid-binding protein DegV